jgi:hypothetical protein
MEGGDANPGMNRSITGYATPASFTPQYGVSTTKTAADLAQEENKKNAEKMKAEEAKKAREEAAIEAERYREQVEADKKAYQKILNSTPKTVKDKEKKEEAIKKHEKILAEHEEKAKADALKSADKAARDAVSGEGDALPKNEPSAAEKAEEATAAA